VKQRRGCLLYEDLGVVIVSCDGVSYAIYGGW
jgi:hypothetical protein